MSETLYFHSPKYELPLLGKKVFCFQDFETCIFVTLAVQKRGDQQPPAVPLATPQVYTHL
jgi:hypothetical protein